MEASFHQDDDVIVIHLKGQIGIETAEAFRVSCLEKLVNEKVVFNLKELNFVGSCGITPLIDCMIELSRTNYPNVKFCEVSSEFQKIFESNKEPKVEIYEDAMRATMALKGYPTTPIYPAPQPVAPETVVPVEAVSQLGQGLQTSSEAPVGPNVNSQPEPMGDVAEPFPVANSWESSSNN